MDNLRHWNALHETDPKYTKNFKRAGGFSGTAQNPTYAIRKMTDKFGPVGIGWGMDKPDFDYVHAQEGEVLVFCTLQLWYMDGDKKAVTYGVGGDSVVSSTKHGLRVDDEGKKKAFTDALTNAMKSIGMAADLHLGMFDDSKYVNDLNKKFSENGEKEEPDTVSKKIQRDLLYALNAYEADNIELFFQDYDKEFNVLPQMMRDYIMDTVENRKKILANGVAPKIEFGFINVAEAVDFAKEANGQIEKSRDVRELSEWVSSHEDMLKALDKMLSAQKYQSPEGTPHQRFLKNYNAKLAFLSQQPLAAE